MTREEEKNKARFEYVSKRLANPDYPTYNAEYELEAAFDKGAKWADSHPHWISVEDELPPYNKNVLVYDAEHPYFEFWWARRYAKGSGRLLDKNGFTTLTDEVNVTHWMYINPPIPNPNLEDNSKKGGEE